MCGGGSSIYFSVGNSHYGWLLLTPPQERILISFRPYTCVALTQLSVMITLRLLTCINQEKNVERNRVYDIPDCNRQDSFDGTLLWKSPEGEGEIKIGQIYLQILLQPSYRCSSRLDFDLFHLSEHHYKSKYMSTWMTSLFFVASTRLHCCS